MPQFPHLKSGHNNGTYLITLSQGFSVSVCGKYLVLLLFSYLELPTSLISPSNGMFSLYSISQLEKQNTTDSQSWSHFSFTFFSQISKTSFYNVQAKVCITLCNKCGGLMATGRLRTQPGQNTRPTTAQHKPRKTQFLVERMSVRPGPQHRRT